MLALDKSLAGYKQKIMTLVDLLHTRQSYRALSDAGLAIGTDKTKVLIANTVSYLFGGEFKSKTTAEVAFTAEDHDIANNASTVQEACYLFCLAADGTPSITMGTIATGAGNAKLPEIPSGKTPIGYVRIAVDAGATPFVAGTDELDEGHLTVTYVDLGYLAERFDSAQ